MNTFNKALLTLSSSLLLMSCSTSIDEYEPQKQNFDIKQYFDGDIIAWGIVQDRNEKVTRRFCVEIEGTWEGNTGVLAEKFYFKDGEISYRNWTLIKSDDGTYKGTAGDVIGEGDATHSGFALQLQYTLSLALDDAEYEVTMDDWMYQLDEHRVINKTAMSKFGINVANITLFFDKELPVKTCQSFI